MKKINILDNINTADLSIRCCNTLHANNVDIIIDVLKLTSEKMKSFRNMSSRTITEIEEFQYEILTKEGVRFVISEVTPENDDMVLTYNYGIWRYKDHPSMLPFWCNANTCVKIIPIPVL